MFDVYKMAENGMETVSRIRVQAASQCKIRSGIYEERGYPYIQFDMNLWELYYSLVDHQFEDQ